MTEFQFEILRFLYYILVAGTMAVKFLFIVLICAMLIDFILSLLKDLRNK